MLMLPEHYSLTPFEDATNIIDNPELLRARAEESGYLFFADLSSGRRRRLRRRHGALRLVECLEVQCSGCPGRAIRTDEDAGFHPSS